MDTRGARSLKTRRKETTMVKVELDQITDEKRGLLLAALRKGGSRSEACQAAGFDSGRLEAWLLRGASEPPEEPFATLFDDVEIAEGFATAEARAIIYKLATGSALEPHEVERLKTPSGELDWLSLATWVEARERQILGTREGAG